MDYSKKLSQFANITHAFTTKKSSNLAFHVEDNIKNVKANHYNLAKKLNYDINKLIH